jgi:hypothetical protein
MQYRISRGRGKMENRAACLDVCINLGLISPHLREPDSSFSGAIGADTASAS